MSDKIIVEVDISGYCPFCHTLKSFHAFYLDGRVPSIVCDKVPKPSGISPLQRGVNQALNPALNHYQLNEGGGVEHSRGTLINSASFADPLACPNCRHINLSTHDFCTACDYDLKDRSVPKGTILRIDGISVTWLCANHPPGSEVEVKKCEKCFCGRGEE